MTKNILKIAALVLLLLAVVVFVPSALPVAGAETLPGIPVYDPVVLASDVVPLDYSAKTPYAPHDSGFSEDNLTYQDSTTYVKVEEFRAFDTNIQVTWVQISDPSQLRSATYNKFPSKNVANPTNIAKREKAVLAINGDYIVYINTGISARNGVVYRERYDSKYDTLMIDDKGDFTIIQSITREKVSDYLSGHSLVHAFTFGPALVVNGVKNEYYPIKTHVATHRTQRMGIAQMDELSYVIVTTEGPDDKNSTGLTLSEFADVFMGLGAKNAYNLDGGSSSWLIMNYSRINGMHGSKHRPIADIIYFATAEKGD